jgi:hypothetical protein
VGRYSTAVAATLVIAAISVALPLDDRVVWWCLFLAVGFTPLLTMFGDTRDHGAALAGLCA